MKYRERGWLDAVRTRIQIGRTCLGNAQKVISKKNQQQKQGRNKQTEKEYKQVK